MDHNLGRKRYRVSKCEKDRKCPRRERRKEIAIRDYFRRAMKKKKKNRVDHYRRKKSKKERQRMSVNGNKSGEGVKVNSSPSGNGAMKRAFLMNKEKGKKKRAERVNWNRKENGYKLT